MQATCATWTPAAAALSATKSQKGNSALHKAYQVSPSTSQIYYRGQDTIPPAWLDGPRQALNGQQI